MSAVAAKAVYRSPIPRPRGRGYLRSVPGQAGPAPVRGPGHALVLGKKAREWVRRAVRELLGAPALAEATHARRLAVLVLAAKTNAGTGKAVLPMSDLARWLGLSVEHVADEVVPWLVERDLVRRHTYAAGGRDVAVEFVVMPMWRVRGRVGHALDLGTRELATLLRWMEALIGPGWSHTDGSVTPTGLLGMLAGRSAAADRLALVLLALEANRGRVPLVGGRIDKGRGRPAATLARLLGCKVSGAAPVLKRLEAAGVLERVHLLVGNLRGKGFLLLPALVAACGGNLSGSPELDVVPEEGEAPQGAGNPQVSGSGEDGSAGQAVLDAATPLHPDHPSVAGVAGESAGVGGFSGYAASGYDRLPDRAGAHGESTAGAAPRPAVADGQGGPLRGEKPKKSPVDERVRRAAQAGAGGQPKAAGGGKTQQRRRVGLPADLGLRVALGPVSGLWGRLTGWQQDQVEAAAEAQLSRLAGVGLLPAMAPQTLADRLTDRLKETGGEALVDRPYPWLIRRGLVQRQACPDRRCDDGIRLDTGGECENCGNMLHFRRAGRARIAAEIDRELPSLGDGERRQVLEDRLRRHVAAEAEDFVRRREQARAQQVRRQAAWAAAQKQAELERQAAAAAHAARHALPCEDCGQERAAGLCEACGYRRQTEAVIEEAGLVAAAWRADLADGRDVAAVSADVRAGMQAKIAAARAEFLQLVSPAELATDPVRAAAVLALGDLEIVQDTAVEYRRCALAMLGRTGEAEAEAQRAYAGEQNRRWYQHNPNGADAVTAATKAADAARERTAQYLLATRLEQLSEQATAHPQSAAPARWSDRLPGLAARPLDGERLGR